MLAQATAAGLVPSAPHITSTPPILLIRPFPQITVVPAKWGGWGLQRYGASPRRVDALQHYRWEDLEQAV